MNYINPYEFISTLSKNILPHTIVITDSGATLAWTMQAFKPNTHFCFVEETTLAVDFRLFSALNHSPMGYAIPAAIGAYYASPESQIIAICGDGAASMNIQELETIAYNKLPIKIFIMNNNQYGIIDQTFKTWLDSTVASNPGNGLGFCDFVSIGNAYGIVSRMLLDIKDVKSVLNSSGPQIGVVPIAPGTEITPRTKFGQRLEQI